MVQDAVYVNIVELRGIAVIWILIWIELHPMGFGTAADLPSLLVYPVD